MRAILLIIALILAGGSTTRLSAQTYQPNWASIDSRPIPDWWQDAKFGIFIHWGVYSVPAFTEKGRYSEWYQNSLTNDSLNGPIKTFHRINYGTRSYYDLADDFHAELFNPDEWAKLFEKAGAKYVVLTSKHHDGFCLWPNQTANRTWGFAWNSGDRGPKRDLVGDLFKSLRKTSVRPGLYFSLYEWYNPLWKFDQRRFASDHTLLQLVELVNNYQPEIIWSDGDWDATPETWQSVHFLAWLYNNSAVRDRVVVNDRWGSGVRFNHAGIYTPEYQPDLDFDQHPWEESRGMGQSYGYNRMEDAWDYNSSRLLIMHLIDKVSRGGNFLLDIGPDAHGKIPPIMQQRLLDIGKWLSVNGEAIYNTRRWRTTSQWSAGKKEGWKTGGDLLLKQTIEPDSGFAVKEVFFTWNPQAKNLYAIFPNWPADRRLVLKDINIPLTTTMTLLGSNQKLRFDNAGGNVYVYLPEYNPSLFTADEAFAIRIAGFGAYAEKPEILVNYAPQTMQPVVSMQCATPGAVIRYAIGNEELNERSKIYQQPLSVSENTKIRARAYGNGMITSGDAQADVRIMPFMPGLSMFRQPDAGLHRLVLNPDQFDLASVERGSLVKSDDVAHFQLDPACTTGTCGMVWKGYINIDQTGGYQFWTNSDDGSVLYIDNQLIVDNNGPHGMQERSGFAHLQQGWHTFKVVYFNSGGAAGLEVQYAPLSTNVRQNIPTAALGH